MRNVILILCGFSALSCCAYLYAAQSILSQEDLMRVKSRYRELYPDADTHDITKPLGGRKTATKAEMDNMKQVVADLRATIQKNADNKPWCAMLQNQIADTYMAMGEFEAAKAEYEKVMKLYPDQKNICDSAASSLGECEKWMNGETPAAAPAAKGKPVPAETKPAVQEPVAAGPARPEAPAGDQYVFELTNGKTIRGEIVKETEKSFTIRFSGNTIVFEKNEIKSFQKAE